MTALAPQINTFQGLARFLTNEIYDDSAMDPTGLCAGKHGCAGYPLFLGVFITLLPKLVPKIMPHMIKNEKMRERFDDESYRQEIEQAFMDRFTENLQLFEKLVKAWRDNTLTFQDLGLSPDNPLAKKDVPQMITGDAGEFQEDLLRGIRFLLDRVDRVGRKDDRITQIADVVWNVMNVAYESIADYLRS